MWISPTPSPCRPSINSPNRYSSGGLIVRALVMHIAGETWVRFPAPPPHGLPYLWSLKASRAVLRDDRQVRLLRKTPQLILSCKHKWTDNPKVPFSNNIYIYIYHIDIIHTCKYSPPPPDEGDNHDCGGLALTLRTHIHTHTHTGQCNWPSWSLGSHYGRQP